MNVCNRHFKTARNMWTLKYIFTRSLCLSHNQYQDYTAFGDDKLSNSISLLAKENVDSITAVTVRMGVLAFVHASLEEDNFGEKAIESDKLNQTAYCIQDFDTQIIERVNPNVELSKLFIQAMKVSSHIPQASCYILLGPSKSSMKNLSPSDTAVLLQQTMVYGMIQGYLCTRTKREGSRLFQLDDELIRELLCLKENTAVYSRDKLRIVKLFINKKRRSLLPGAVNKVLPSFIIEEDRKNKFVATKAQEQRLISESLFSLLAFCKMMFLSR